MKRQRSGRGQQGYRWWWTVARLSSTGSCSPKGSWVTA